MRRVLLWLGVVALLYALCLVVFYSTNIATIIAIRGFEPLTWEVMYVLFLRAAVICIPLAIVSSLFVVFRARLGGR